VITASEVPGLTYLPDYLGRPEQHDLLDTIDRLPWRGDLKRRVQHYGYRYDYTRKRIDEDLYLGPLPGWADDLAARLQQTGHAPRDLDQLIVNEYLPGQGIAAHVDCVPCFADTVLSLSLGSACVMTFSHPAEETQRDILLEPGSLLAMSGPARYEWRHGIAPRKTDRYDGSVHPRSRRVSLTFRSVLRRTPDSGHSTGGRG
jgi:alkylated DNA repair dioxygenase AlkB